MGFTPRPFATDSRPVRELKLPECPDSHGLTRWPLALDHEQRRRQLQATLELAHIVSLFIANCTKQRGFERRLRFKGRKVI